VFTHNHMNIDKKNQPQLLRQEQPFIWPMVIQIGLGTGMYISTYFVLFRFGIFVSLNCIPFQFLCTLHFVSFRSVSLRYISLRFISFSSVSFRFGKFRSASFRFVPFRYVSFCVSFRILQVPYLKWHNRAMITSSNSRLDRTLKLKLEQRAAFY
jgi:hypothetical protein